jgi:acyl carrier protein
MSGKGRTRQAVTPLEERLEDPMSSAIHDKIRGFIIENILEADGKELEDDTDLLKDGILDSFGLTQFIVYIEQAFDIRVPPEQVTPASFRTIGDIAAMLMPLIEGDRAPGSQPPR